MSDQQPHWIPGSAPQEPHWIPGSSDTHPPGSTGYEPPGSTGTDERPDAASRNRTNVTVVQEFITSKFDVSFHRILTADLVKVLYVLAIAGLGLLSLSWLVSAFEVGGIGRILGALVGAPIVFLGGVIAVRVLLELVMVVFGIGDDLRAGASDLHDRSPRV